MSTLFVQVIALVALAVQSSAATASRDVPFETLVRGFSTLQAAQDRVILDDDEWTRFWYDLYPNPDTRPPRPDVDFAERMVIVVASGHPSPRHQIRIDRVRMVRDAAVVVIHQTRITQRCGLFMDPGYAVHVVSAPRIGIVTFRRIDDLPCAMDTPSHTTPSN